MSPDLTITNTDLVDRQATTVAERLDSLPFTDWEFYVEVYSKQTAACANDKVEYGTVERIGTCIRVAAAGGGTASAYTSSTEPAELQAILDGLETAARLIVAPNDDVLPDSFPAAGTERLPEGGIDIGDEGAIRALARSVGSPRRLIVSQLTKQMVVQRANREPYRDVEYELGATAYLHVTERDVFYPTAVMPPGVNSFGLLEEQLTTAVLACPPVGTTAKFDQQNKLPELIVLHPSVANATYRLALRLARAADIEPCDAPDGLKMADDPNCPGSVTQRTFDDVGERTAKVPIIEKGRLLAVDPASLARRRSSYRSQPRPGSITMTMNTPESVADLNPGGMEHLWIDGIHFSESAVVQPTDLVRGPVEGWVVRNGRPALLGTARLAVRWCDLLGAIVATAGEPQNTGNPHNAFVAPLVLDSRRLRSGWLRW